MAPDHGAHQSVQAAPLTTCCAMLPTRWRETFLLTTSSNLINEGLAATLRMGRVDSMARFAPFELARFTRRDLV